MQERRKVLDAPGIVDHQQAAPIIERVGQRGLGGVDGAEAGARAGEGLDQVGDAADQIVGLLAQRDAQDAVAERVLDVAVVAQRIGERGLPVAAGAAQRRGDGHRLALRVEELALERVELLGARDEALGQRIGHERHALLAGRPLEHLDQPRATLGNVDVVAMRALHPARQVREVELARAGDRRDPPALLARELPFPRHVGRAQRGRRQHQHDMLDAANRRLDLAPPILTALEIGEIAVEGEILGLEQRLQASSELEAVLARVGDEHARSAGVPHSGKYCSRPRRVKIPPPAGSRRGSAQPRYARFHGAS